MTVGALKRLTIEHLRGSVRPFTMEFEKGRSLTIVYGENGSGKSTICDGFDFLGNGRVGSLEGRGLGKTTPFWPSIGAAGSDVRVTLETADGSFGAALAGGESVATPATDRPLTEVLRRSRIRSLVEATAANRYEEIRRFVDVSGVEVSEGNLRSLIRSLEADSREAVARVDENRGTIAQFWEEAGTPGGNALSWAEGEATRDSDAPNEETKLLRTFLEVVASLRPYVPQLQDAEAGLLAAQKERSDRQQEREQRVSDMTAEGPTVIAILEAAQTHFRESPHPDACPLCESSERMEGLPERVDERLLAIKALKGLRKAELALRDTEAREAAALERLRSLRSNAQVLAKQANEMLGAGEGSERVARPASPVPMDVGEWSEWLANNELTFAGWRASEEAAADKKHFYATLRRALTTLRENSDRHRELERLLPRLRATLNVLEEERRRYVDALLSAIANEVGRLYEAVHQGEGLNKISLALDPRRRASLDIGVDFGGLSGAPPQAYFSDSHLDTLGLCVFLALAARESPERKILVLDDVLASVDEPHVDRLIEMLYEEAKRFRHVIITTHYRAWREKYRWGKLVNGKCQWVELGHWNSASGICLSGLSTGPLRELRQHLQGTPPSLQGACASAGVLLEAICDFLTLQYECSVPRRKLGLTLNDLLQGISGKLKQALRVEVRQSDGSYQDVPLGTMLGRLQNMTQARNVFGCHYNELAHHLPAADALEFATLVHDLGSALICETEGWPASRDSGSYWSTKGETRRLHPLLKPS